MYISPQLLEKVFVRGSLKNTETGFEFKLKNVVDSGTIGGIKGLMVDGNPIPVSAITVRSPNIERKAEEITYQNPLPLNYGSEITLHASADPLAAGAHELVLTMVAIEAGKLDLKISMELA
jgi:chorismate synthase